MNLSDILICFGGLKEQNITQKQAKKVICFTKKLINRGWTLSQITKRLCDYHKKNPEEFINLKVNKIFSDIFKNKKPPLKFKNNLLKDKNYYHKELIVVPGKRKKINIKNCKIIKTNPLFFKYIIEIYTLNDLLNYYHNFIKQKDLNCNIKKYNKKVFSSLVNNTNLDVILFSIDYLKKETKQKSYSFPSSSKILYQYLQQGKTFYEKIKNNISTKEFPYYKFYLKKIKLGGDNSNGKKEKKDKRINCSS